MHCLNILTSECIHFNTNHIKTLPCVLLYNKILFMKINFIERFALILLEFRKKRFYLIRDFKKLIIKFKLFYI